MSRPGKNEIVRVEIDNLAFGGKGVGKISGYVLFVEGGLPGDTAEVRLLRTKSNFAEGRIEKLIVPSKYRITPPCEHFDFCGGCRWQNLEYSIQKKYKENQLREALVHIGKILDPSIESIIGAHKIYYYRNKMEFSFQAGEDGETILGLHRAGRFQDVFQLRKCHLQSESSNEIVNFVRGRAVELGLPPYHIKRHEGYLRFLVIREGKFTGETLVNIVTGAGEHDGIQTLGQEIGRRFKNVVSVSHTVNSQRANMASGDKEVILFGSDHIRELLGEKEFRISANSFFQTNSYQIKRLYDLVVEYSEPDRLDRTADLYSGTGTIAIYIAGLVRSVEGVESNLESIENARTNARLNSVTNCDFIAADVEEYLKSAANNGAKYDLMILDPPRAGCHPKAIKSILHIRPRKIVYISCNPATLARDISELAEDGYRLEKAVPIDLFPQTYHIEAVCRLTLVG
ncbi:MAG: 23S rRNA (uracil(1939)-C(5))-methyltransferase RlmD [Candidatus Zixiibacteriota bacterium]|nr:MAG: 23S rRNA (uracil(1939)-C(5))-methyltransferase RlmD [candidate division Zixibacteria bacterium]